MPQKYVCQAGEWDGEMAYWVFCGEEEVAVISFRIEYFEEGMAFTIGHLWVAKNYRRNGIASGLVEKVRREAAPYGVQGIALSVGTDQIRQADLVAFYKACGAQIKDDVAFFFSPFIRKEN